MTTESARQIGPNDVPYFIRNTAYWRKSRLERRSESNDSAPGDCDAPWLDYLDNSVHAAPEAVLNLDRANWRLLLDLPPGARVLDIGAGLGTNAHALARHYRQVVAVESTQQSLRFMQRRFTQEGLLNANIIGGSLEALPFAPNSFDLIVLSGAIDTGAEVPPALKDGALQSLHRLLTPAGRLSFGIENRFDIRCMLDRGASGSLLLPFLPRALTQCYAKRRRLDGRRACLYGSYGYRQLLLKAGFSRVDIYLALPNHLDPSYFLPLDSNVYSYYSGNFNATYNSRLQYVARRALLALRILHYFGTSFWIVAHK
jgi:SAM-dependent methyltransferase